MYRSPDVLTAMRSSRRYDRDRVDPRRPNDTPPARAGVRAQKSERRPDYGCVDWFVYEERSEQELV